VASISLRARVQGWLIGPYGADGARHGLVSEFRSRRVSGQAAGPGQGRDASAIQSWLPPEKGAPARP
jgi:hypothetical protein